MARRKKEITEDSLSDIDMSNVPKPIDGLSKREEKVWNRITYALAKHGLINETDAIMIHLICQSFISLMDSTFELEEYKSGNNGSIMCTLPNGYSKPHELVAVVENQRKELARYLREAGLTTTAFIELMKMRRDTEVADRNAASPLDDFMSRRPGIQ